MTSRIITKSIMSRLVALNDGTKIPQLGFGSWYLGDDKSKHDSEVEAIKTAIRSGMTLIDTAEMYGDGRSEKILGEAIKAILSEIPRDKLFIVSKVLPSNASRKKIFNSCNNSLKRLGVDYIDLYLLHWYGRYELKETVECFEELIQQGKIKRWEVSNFDVSEMKELLSVPNGNHCAVNQVLYNVCSRGIEFDLLPWLKEKNIPIMAYCPLVQAGDLNRGLYENKILKKIAEKHSATISQILLSFVMRFDNVIAIPRSGNKNHVIENSKAVNVLLSEEDLNEINKEFPPPSRKIPLEIV